jgi:hypothetical protein
MAEGASQLLHKKMDAMPGDPDVTNTQTLERSQK